MSQEGSVSKTGVEAKEVEVTAVATGVSQTVRGVHVIGGSFNVAARDVVYQQHTHYHGAARDNDIPSCSDATPTFYVDALGRLWISQWEMFRLWLDSDGYKLLQIVKGSEMPGAFKVSLALFFLVAGHASFYSGRQKQKTWVPNPYLLSCAGPGKSVDDVDPPNSSEGSLGAATPAFAAMIR